MSIRNRLLILLLGVSLVPLAGYFVFQISFARIARNRVANTLRSTSEQRTRFELLQTIDNYGEHLTISAQAVRYALRHYADQVEKALRSVELDSPQISEKRYMIEPAARDLMQETRKYRFPDAESGRETAIDFATLFIRPADGDTPKLLQSQLPQLAAKCGDVYSVNPEGKLWIYTALEDGTVALYPSPARWPYGDGYDLRKEPWYSKAKASGRLTPTQRIEPLTGRTVMTVAMPLSSENGAFAGVVAVDIDLSGVLERMEIPGQLQEGAWKLLVRLPDKGQFHADEAEVLCWNAFGEGRQSAKSPSRLSDVCDADSVGAIIEDARCGNAGVVRMPYKGEDSFWAYGPSQRGGGFPILVVPYSRVVEQANNARQTLLRDNVRSIQAATALILAVIVAGVVLAVMRARNVTAPITSLAEAAGRLAEGDFDAHVSIKTGDELEQLGEIFNQTGPKLKQMEKMQRSLELARAIQQNLLPRTAPELEGFELAGRCRYCDETGGDYYDFIEEIGPGKVGIALGDVTGHGIGAALLMAAARSVLRSNAATHNTDIVGLFGVLNRHFESDTDYDKFITLFYGVLDGEEKSLIWASGGHEPALWYHSRTGEIEELPNTGMVIGIVEDAAFEQGGPVVLETGDIVVVGTDGIWEAQNESGEAFGKERFCAIVTENSSLTADQICRKVIDNVAAHCDQAPQMDDVTLVVIKVL